MPGGRFAQVAQCPDDGSCPGGEGPQLFVAVESFELDVFEVTVGRFRAFLRNYDAWRAANFPARYADPELRRWGTRWDRFLPGDASSFAKALSCHPERQTWTQQAAGHELRPINCVSWFEAQAFCLWDGGRLPSDVEWEYAAAGGTEQRLYPWGSSQPATTLANWSADGLFAELKPVGCCDAGKGRWGHLDLAGNVAEWVAGFFAGRPNAEDGLVHRQLRGGSSGARSYYLRTVARVTDLSNDHDSVAGFRCAR